MNISWAATSPASRRFVPTENHSDISGLAARFEELRDQGQGYLEVRRGGNFPVLTFGFTGDAGVVHLMPNDETTYLLATGDAAAPDVEVLVMDEVVGFTGDFALNVDRAWQVVEQFARTGDIGDVGEWCEL